MRQLKFYKEYDKSFGERWFVDLPEWEGDKSDLEMVSGSDSLLDLLAQSHNEVRLMVSEEKFENADTIRYIRQATEVGNGAFYKVESIGTIPYDLDIWLCDVMLFVFKHFPMIIYIKTL